MRPIGIGKEDSDYEEAEEVAEKKLHRIQGSALRWPLFKSVLSKIQSHKGVDSVLGLSL